MEAGYPLYLKFPWEFPGILNFLWILIAQRHILLIAVSCHVPVCVRLSHSLKRLLTYLLTYLISIEKSVHGA